MERKVGPAPRHPTEEARLRMREKPDRVPLMHQTWRSLLLLHWEWDAFDIQRRLPEGLFVDTHEGKAYVGISPFFLENLRPILVPALPGISHFLELNVRTYAFDRSGRPGVWFFSLDCNQWLAVQAARRVFHLPYQWAEMQADESSGKVEFTSRRKNTDAANTTTFSFAPADQRVNMASPRSLEFFLAERYLLFSRAQRTGKLYSARVHHAPHPLVNVTLEKWDQHMLELNDLVTAARPPDHQMLSLQVDTTIYSIEEIDSAAA
jgi:uncharacterized protein